jgi:quinoprotein glucose dehydrogenase
VRGARKCSTWRWWASVAVLICATGCGGQRWTKPNNPEFPEVRRATEWPAYGGDSGGLRYSPLSQIDAGNVDELEVAWTYRHGDISDSDDPIGTSGFEATPILVDGILYFSTPFGRVIALDPATGAEHWTYDHDFDRSGSYLFIASRGVSSWRARHGDADASSSTNCNRRIYVATRDAYLISLDALTGRPCKDFGAEGRIDLARGAGPELWRGEYGVTSPPEVIGDLIVVGGIILDDIRTDAPSGVVRAFDARTGELEWAWDLAPPGFDHAERPVSTDGYALGSPNVWAPMSSDPERDLLFVPTGNPSPDFWRGEAPDMDYYGSSVVALRASTGEIVWHFQTVHHDLWNYDVPAQPTLVEIERDDGTIPALIQGTKMGLLFVLNRETGEPIFGVEERPVPQGAVPGERLSPTQPFPIKPPPLGPLAITPAEVGGMTYWDKRACRKALAEIRNEGIYTPPSLEGSLLYPATTGGINWGGVAVDPVRQVVVVNTNEIAAEVTRLVPRTEFDRERPEQYDPMRAPQDGTPYGMVKDGLLSSLGFPCNGLPLGRLTAVDLESGEIVWQRPFGGLRDLIWFPWKLDLGLPNYGGPLVTASGLVFIGAALGPYLRAYDTATGEEIWRGKLPTGGQATPMTYRVDDLPGGNRQFIVIAAGGHFLFHEAFGQELGDTIVAFALPSNEERDPNQ